MSDQAVARAMMDVARTDLRAAWALLERYKKYRPEIYPVKDGWRVYLDSLKGQSEVGDICVESRSIEEAIVSAVGKLLEKKRHASSR